MKRYFITGGAGFIGSHLTDHLLKCGYQVSVFDNFSTGFIEFLKEAQKNPLFSLVKGDLLDKKALFQAMQGHDFVFHMAANADVRFGLNHPEKDLTQNTLATFNVLEGMRAHRIHHIVFPSTGSVYGESKVFPTPEEAPFPIQTSLYGASKVAGESLISAYCEGFGFQGWIFRFVSVLGERYSHGHVYDFYQKLTDNPNCLEVFGNGKQRKSYMYVQDCIEAMLLAIKKGKEKVNVFNLGIPDYIDVDFSIRCITKQLGLSPKLYYTGGERGWVGDNPFIFLDVNKITNLGWHPKISIKEGITRTLNWLKDNRWIYQKRKPLSIASKN